MFISTRHQNQTLEVCRMKRRKQPKGDPAYPAALSDPLTEPPVAEGDAACGEEEEEDVYDEG